ncbi:chloride conductance regulatory protein ICln [Tanacetum coccineum]
MSKWRNTKIIPAFELYKGENQIESSDKSESLLSGSLAFAIDTGDEDDESQSCDSESSETPLDFSKITETRLVLSNPTQCIIDISLNTLFEVFCECAELNPEPVEGNITITTTKILYVPFPDSTIAEAYFHRGAARGRTYSCRLQHSKGISLAFGSSF